MNKYFYKCKYFRTLIWKFSAKKNSNEKERRQMKLSQKRKKCEQMTD